MPKKIRILVTVQLLGDIHDEGNLYLSNIYCFYLYNLYLIERILAGVDRIMHDN